MSTAEHTGACKRFACQVQTCLSKHGDDERHCAWAIDRLKACCLKNSGSLHCSFPDVRDQPAATALPRSAVPPLAGRHDSSSKQ